MRRHARARLLGWAFFVFVFLVILVSALIAASAGATAQELPGNENQTQTEEQPTQLYDQLFDLDIHSVEFVKTDDLGHTVRVEATWRGRTPQQLTVTQIPDGKDVAIERRTIRPDERTEFQFDLIDGSAAILYTKQSIDQGRATKLKPGDGWLLSGPWDSTDAQISGIAGLLAGLIVTAVLAYRKVATHDAEPERVL